MSSSQVRLLRRADVRRCLEGADVLGAVREALIASAEGRVRAPGAMSFDFGERGEAHVKGAYVEGAGEWAVKLASGFYDNPRQGLPAASGMTLLASAETGVPLAIVLDGGLLTDVRTAAAGTVAIDALAPAEVERVGIVGCGTQARVQLEYLCGRRRPGRVVAYGRDRERAAAFAAETSERLGVEVTATGDVRAAVEGAEVVLTVTPARRFLVEAGWVDPGATVVAVGADMPGKQELQPRLLERAELLVADDPAQAAEVGELQYAPAAVRERARALGEVLAAPPSRDGIAVVDLTGLGAQDAAIASMVAERAAELGVGEQLSLD
ncbi:MAG TPA: ornithine cyclodeaminase family protein [Solirubrobacterales bacterium]|jgi:ornithine cyclodeaminase